MVFKTRLSKKERAFFIGKCFRSVLKSRRACISTKKSDTFVSLIFLLMVGPIGFEPMTFRTSSGCSPS